MGSTTANILVYQRSGGLSTTWQITGKVRLQQGDRPSWNINKDGKHIFWPCSKPGTIYAEGVIMAAIFFSGDEQVEKIAGKIYGDSATLGVHNENYEYLKLLSAIKNTSRDLEFVIMSHLVVPPDRLNDIKKLGVTVKIASLNSVEEYIHNFGKDK